jgi:hypothetical protein
LEEKNKEYAVINTIENPENLYILDFFNKKTISISENNYRNSKKNNKFILLKNHILIAGTDDG